MNERTAHAGISILPMSFIFLHVLVVVHSSYTIILMSRFLTAMHHKAYHLIIVIMLCLTSFFVHFVQLAAQTGAASFGTLRLGGLLKSYVIKAVFHL